MRAARLLPRSPLAAVLLPPLLAACASTRDTEPVELPPLPPSSPDASAPPSPLPPPDAAAATPPVVPADPMPPAEAAFRWPAQGALVERGGAQQGIAVRASGDVVAVKSGVVRLTLASWAGRRNLIIVRHADGWLSEYSDVDEVLAPQGRAVRQGEPIARLRPGGTLRFRLYREKQPVDPLAYLR